MAGRVSRDSRDSRDGRDGGQDNPDGISSVGNGTVYNRMCTKWRHEKGSPDTKGFPDKKIEQVMGIEPTYLAWKASVLPLNYTCIYAIHAAVNRGDRIRTCDLLVPNQAL